MSITAWDLCFHKGKEYSSLSKQELQRRKEEYERLPEAAKKLFAKPLPLERDK